MFIQKKIDCISEDINKWQANVICYYSNDIAPYYLRNISQNVSVYLHPNMY